MQDTTLSLSSLPYLNSLISEFFQHYETSMEADDIFLHGRNIVMCSHAPSKTTFYKFANIHKFILTALMFPAAQTQNNTAASMQQRLLSGLPTPSSSASAGSATGQDSCCQLFVYFYILFVYFLNRRDEEQHRAEQQPRSRLVRAGLVQRQRRRGRRSQQR